MSNPNQLILEIDPNLQNKVWSNSQQAATNFSRWQIYLNQLTLNTFIDYALEEQGETVTKEPTFEGIGELVNGTAIKLGNVRLVLIPSEAEDLEELRVDREWLDIPQWLADYYVGIRINVDDGYLCLWGYTTHQQLKTKGRYDESDRSYSLENTDVIDDLNTFWVARELCPEEETQAAIADLVELETSQAQNLIQRLGNSQNLLPRQSIPFPLWAALIVNDTWRDALITKRRGQIKISVLQWLTAEASQIIAEMGWRQIEFQVSTVGTRGDTSTTNSRQALARKIAIARSDYELKLIPVEISTESNIWGFELSNLAIGAMIPQGFILRLLTETGEAFTGNEAIAKTTVESLYLEVALDRGEGLIWEIEPVPEDYQTQVLYF